jgi:hypothetical protein
MTNESGTFVVKIFPGPYSWKCSCDYGATMHKGVYGRSIMLMSDPDLNPQGLVEEAERWLDRTEPHWRTYARNGRVIENSISNLM